MLYREICNWQVYPTSQKLTRGDGLRLFRKKVRLFIICLFVEKDEIERSVFMIMC